MVWKDCGSLCFSKRSREWHIYCLTSDEIKFLYLSSCVMFLTNGRFIGRKAFREQNKKRKETVWWKYQRHMRSVKMGFGHPNSALATNKVRAFTSIQGVLQQKVRWRIVNNGKKWRIQSRRRKKIKLYNLTKQKFKCLWRLVPKDKSGDSSTNVLRLKFHKLWGNCEPLGSSNTQTFENGKFAPSPVALLKAAMLDLIMDCSTCKAVSPSDAGAETLDDEVSYARCAGALWLLDGMCLWNVAVDSIIYYLISSFQLFVVLLCFV